MTGPLSQDKNVRPLRYSVVVPVFNEEESLPVLIPELVEVMESLQEPYEILFIDDGSTDRSPQILEDLRLRHPAAVKISRFPQRSGQTLAMRRGLEVAGGDIIITLDADLQNDPADIPKLLAKMASGYDVVCGWRQDRRDEPLKTSLSKLGNVSQRMLTGLSIHDVSCTLRAYRRACIGKIPLNWEGQHRFIPLSLSLQGFKVSEILANHRPRKFGLSKYSHKRIFKVAVDFFRVLLSRGER